VQRRLARTIYGRAAIGIFGDGTHAAADIDNQLALGARDIVRQGFGEVKGCDDVDAHDVEPGVCIRSAARPANGVVDQYVDRLTIQAPHEVGDLLGVPHVEHLDFDIAVDFLQDSSFIWLPAAGDDLPAIGSVLADKFEAETAVGASDKNTRHDDPLSTISK